MTSKTKRLSDEEYQDLLDYANELTSEVAEQSKTLVYELQKLRDLMGELGDDDG